MSPVIRISETDWERLKTWAIPLEDSASDALRKVLDAAEAYRNTSAADQPLGPDHDLSIGHNGSSQVILGPTEEHSMDAISKTDGPEHAIEIKRLPRGQRTPQHAYDVPILESLHELGGKAKGKEVLAKVELKVKHLLSDVDYEIVSNGTQVRWSNTAQFARLALVKRGLIKPVEESGRGIWELTEQGIAEVEKTRG